MPAMNSDLVLRVFSYHDLGGEEPERVYHCFLLGVFTEFKHYQIQSNKESGKGRFDILLIPETLEYKDVIIEVKRSKTDKAEIIQLTKPPQKWLVECKRFTNNKVGLKLSGVLKK